MVSCDANVLAFSAVYFNPAKTIGGMFEADVFCTMGLLFSTFVSLTSMSVYWFFELQSGYEWLADILVLLMIGVGMSAAAWMKVWMAKPPFNTGTRSYSSTHVAYSNLYVHSLQHDGHYSLHCVSGDDLSPIHNF